jgi:DNA polymerase-3 subunit delta'
MAFKDIVGNERIKRVLQLSLQKGRLPNSLLFAGPEGVGKRRTAFVLAKALCCRSREGDSCDACNTCRLIDKAAREGKNHHPDVIEIGPERDVIKIEKMRELKSLAYLRPIMGERRVFLVDQAETLNEEAANSILKVLEEPPSFTHIILITSNLDRILPTIRSRCRLLDFSPICAADIERELERKGLAHDRAVILAALSRGNLEEALEADWDELAERRRAAWELFRALLRREKASLFLENYAFLRRKDAEKELPAVLEMFATFGRDLVLLKEGGDPAYLLNPDYAETLRAESRDLSLDRSLGFLAEVDAVLAGLDRSLNVGLLVSAFYSSIINRL